MGRPCTMGGQCTVQVVREAYTSPYTGKSFEEYHRQCTKCGNKQDEASQHEVTKFKMDAARLVRSLGNKNE